MGSALEQGQSLVAAVDRIRRAGSREELDRPYAMMTVASDQEVRLVVMLDDKKTEAYFDQFTPNFPPKRFFFAIEFLREHIAPGQRLIDIGCGDGATLALIRRETELEDLTGLDIAPAYLEHAKEATGCGTIVGSILDDSLVSEHESQYDYAVLGAVLHHLIGSSRRQSRLAAQRCLENSLRLLRRGGHLVVFEPTFRPRSLMWGVFWIKLILGSMIPRRLELGRSWLNVAQPVVSYYSRDEVEKMIDRTGARSVESHDVEPTRLGFVIERTAVSTIVQRPN